MLYEIPPDAPAIEFPAGLLVPSRLLYSVEDTDGIDPDGYDLQMEIVFDGQRYVCQELRVRQSKVGPPVTGEALRSVRVQDELREAIRLVVLDSAHATEDGSIEITRRPEAVPPEGIAKRGPTDEVLRWVAQIHELAVAFNDPPTKSVQNQLGVSRATAGRWVAAARGRGLIADVPPDSGEGSSK